jgi:superfamily II DNA or RNA helicase
MSKREKNNIARMLCYEKHKIKQEADQYEEYMIHYHFTKYNDITYHWKNIPEEWLFESGYIHSYNELRKKRLLQQTNNCIGEYGLDGMTYNKELESYQGLQAKHYNEKNTLTANCLGTFLSSIMCIFLKSNKLAGIIYHTCKLQIDFKQNTQQCNSIYKTEKLDFNKIDIKQKPFKLRDYQIDAINNCKKYNNGIYLTRMACGTGKTTIFSHLAKSYNKIICISPLKILVDKNHNCILNNLNDYDNAIFDSDHNEIDEQTINDFLKKDKYLISTTFKTARDVFSKIDFSDYNILLIIDEGHNLHDEDKIWDIARNINNSHIFTGTKTEELENNITEEINYLSLGDAIQQKLVCDYQIYLPLNIDGKIDVNYEENEIIEQSDVETKIMFILKGLLFTGSKRCIIYLTSKQDIFDYEGLMIQKAESFHGIKLNTFKIYEGVTPNKRKTEIEGFESNINSNELNIMFSIRILDEGIDIVKCDSIFITNITDNTSEKRTVQRMCRANRLNEDNRCKIANIFIWTDDNNKICNMLNYLKLEDPTFSSKIRSITVDYDSAGNKREIEKENTILNKLYFNTKCVTLSELSEIKFKIWDDLTIEQEGLLKKREIINHETYGEIKIGIWQDNQKQKWNKNKMTENEKIKFLGNPYFKEWIKKEKKENKKIPQETLFQLWNVLTIKRGELIKKTEVINHENYGQINIGKWQSTQKQKWTKNQMTENEKIKFLANPYFKAWTEQEKKKIPQETLFQLWNDLTIKREELIKQTEVINHENYGQIDIGKWQYRKKKNGLKIK